MHQKQLKRGSINRLLTHVKGGAVSQRVNKGFALTSLLVAAFTHGSLCLSQKAEMQMEEPSVQNQHQHSGLKIPFKCHVNMREEPEEEPRM